MKTERCQVMIIGAGPGGYVCAIRAAQLGLNTVVIEQEDLGGTCLNVGCIPSKALIHAADEFFKMVQLQAETPLGIKASGAEIDLSQTMAWKDQIVSRLTKGVAGLVQNAGAQVVQGTARLVDGKTALIETQEGTRRFTADHLVIATGSKANALDVLPFGGKVISSTQALAMTKIPKSPVVVGGGYIGLEIGTAFAKLGSDVTIIEAGPSILPQYDRDLTGPVLKRLRKLGVTVHVRTKAKGMSDDGAVLFVAAPEGEMQLPADRVLVTVGRTPLVNGFGLSDLHLDMADNHIVIDAFCATSMRGVFAIGDVTGAPMLAHRAMAQGMIVAEHIAGRRSVWDKRVVPEICFTDPEIVSVGALPSDVEDAAVETFPFSASGRAMTLDRDDGQVRLVFDRTNELILGIQAVGAGVSEMASGFALALEMGATLTDIGQTIHAHPTLGEAFQEAALKGLGQALHI